MPPEKILPTLLIIIDIGAAVVYSFTGNTQQIVYWTSAATITFAVTWL